MNLACMFEDKMYYIGLSTEEIKFRLCTSQVDHQYAETNIARNVVQT